MPVQFMSHPFRADSTVTTNPRAIPWAGICYPFRARFHKLAYAPDPGSVALCATRDMNLEILSIPVPVNPREYHLTIDDSLQTHSFNFNPGVVINRKSLNPLEFSSPQDTSHKC